VPLPPLQRGVLQKTGLVDCALQAAEARGGGGWCGVPSRAGSRTLLQL
jgi:hypothetical protein